MSEANYDNNVAKGGTGEGTVDIKFSHVQLYVDDICPRSEYKELEASMNRFQTSFSQENDGNTASPNTPADIERGRQLWESMQGVSSEETAAFVPHGRDVVKVSITYTESCNSLVLSLIFSLVYHVSN